jgi:hypothetical protein
MVRKHPFGTPLEARGKQGGQGERAGNVGERRGRFKGEIRARMG